MHVEEPHVLNNWSVIICAKTAKEICNVFKYRVPGSGSKIGIRYQLLGKHTRLSIHSAKETYVTTV